jgi:hypothetical protein
MFRCSGTNRSSTDTCPPQKTPTGPSLLGHPRSEFLKLQRIPFAEEAVSTVSCRSKQPLEIGSVNGTALLDASALNTWQFLTTASLVQSVLSYERGAALISSAAPRP